LEVYGKNAVKVWDQWLLSKNMTSYHDETLEVFYEDALSDTENRIT
jgi:hypothetical protein